MEKLTKENKLGETFTWNGHTLEVAEVEGSGRPLQRMLVF